jgi:hypothetical protein
MKRPFRGLQPLAWLGLATAAVLAVGCSSGHAATVASARSQARLTDPLWTWTYSVTGHGKTLTLRSVGHDPCSDRVAILAGTWTTTVT